MVDFFDCDHLLVFPGIDIFLFPGLESYLMRATDSYLCEGLVHMAIISNSG